MTAPGKVTPPRAEVNPPAEEKQQLSRRLVRIILGGTGFAAFDDNPSTDKYVKILFVDPQQGLALPGDLSALRAEPPRKAPSQADLHRPVGGRRRPKTGNRLRISRPSRCGQQVDAPKTGSKPTNSNLSGRSDCNRPRRRRQACPPRSEENLRSERELTSP